MQTNVLIEECRCSRAQIFYIEENGEDCRIFEAKLEALGNNEPCPRCKQLNTYRVILGEPNVILSKGARVV